MTNSHPTVSVQRLLALGLALAASFAWTVPVIAQALPSAFTSATRYDVGGRVTGTISTDPDGGGVLPFSATRVSYDPLGRVVKVETGTLASWKDEAIRPADWGADFAPQTTVETEWSSKSRIMSERRRGSDGLAASLIEYSYDPDGRLLCVAVRMNLDIFDEPLGDACVQRTAGDFGADRITRYGYNQFGDVTRVERGVGTQLAQTEVEYTRTLMGDPETIKDANGNLARLEYDLLRRNIRWTFPSKTAIGQTNEADYEAYAYDANGNLMELRKRDGSVISYSYDALNRMKVKSFADRSDLDNHHERAVHYSYDLRGLQTEARFFSGGPGVFTSYDGFGRIESVADTMDGRNLTLAYSYDANGNRTGVTHPDQQTFGYDFDRLNRMTRITQPGVTAPLVNAYYNERGGLDRLKQGTNSLFGYDAAGRLSSIYHGMVGTSADVGYTFARNPAGQIVSEGQDNDSYSWPGPFGAANSASEDISRNYATNGLNQYTGAGEAAFTYDANGNLTSSTAPDQSGAWRTTLYVYDHENRLVEAVVPVYGAADRVFELRYDPLGRLYRIDEIGVGRTTFLHDGDALVAEYGSTGQLERRYLHGADGAADDPLVWFEGAGTSETDRRYLKRDARGSIVAVADHLGNAVAINSYDEYGNPERATAILPGSANNTGRFQYTGQIWFPELGLFYYKARWYSPSLGRFLQTDPIGYEDQFNLYAYVANDPVNRSDFSGNESASITCMNNACGQGELSDEQVGNLVMVGAVAFDVLNTPVSPGPDATIVVTASRASVEAAKRPGFITRAWRGIKGFFGGKKEGALPKPPTGRGSVPRSERDPRRSFSPSERAAKRQEQGGQCANGCGKTIDETNSEGHHIERHADGGPTTPDNHAEVCKDCHRDLHRPE